MRKASQRGVEVALANAVIATRRGVVGFSVVALSGSWVVAPRSWAGGVVAMIARAAA